MVKPLIGAIGLSLSPEEYYTMLQVLDPQSLNCIHLNALSQALLNLMTHFDGKLFTESL